MVSLWQFGMNNICLFMSLVIFLLLFQFCIDNDMILVDILYGTHNPKELKVVIGRIKMQVQCFNSNYDVESYEKLMNWKDCLNFRIAPRDYKPKLIAANKNV